MSAALVNTSSICLGQRQQHRRAATIHTIPGYAPTAETSASLFDLERYVVDEPLVLPYATKAHSGPAPVPPTLD